MSDGENKHFQTYNYMHIMFANKTSSERFPISL